MNTEQSSTVVIVYESMFGGTRRIAEAIAGGVRPNASVVVVPVSEADSVGTDADLLVLGAPTHTHGLSRPESRAEAVKWASDPARGLALEPGAQSDGIREWLAAADTLPAQVAAFDTRVDIPQLFSGSAASAIDKRVRKRGAHTLVAPESFLVDKDSHLKEGELERAARWGEQLVTALTGELYRSR